MTRTAWRWARLLGGVAVLGFVLWRVGAGGFVDGLRATSPAALLAGLVLTFVTTLAAAWRWSLVAHGLGAGMSLRAAVGAYYRSQFLNTALPGGVLGDVHRGVQHGADAGDLARGLRTVMWERVAGQVVQLVVALVVLLAVPSPVRFAMPYALAGAVALAVALALLHRLPVRWIAAVRAELRAALLAPEIWPGVVLASLVVVAGHTTAFLVAVHAAGVHAGVGRLLPIAMLVLVAMSVPVNVGGWGPREGVAAWVFGAAGLGASAGLAAATVYGVMVFVASLPGAFSLVWPLVLRRRVAPDPPARVPVGVGGARG